MSSEWVTNLANAWYEAAQERGVSTDDYQAIRHPVKEFVDAEAHAGIAFRENAPVVVAIAGTRILCISVVPAGRDEEERAAEVLSVPLDAPVAIRVVTTFEQTQHSAFRVRGWDLQVPGLDGLQLVTRTPIGSSLVSDPGGEAVMRAALNVLG